MGRRKDKVTPKKLTRLDLQAEAIRLRRDEDLSYQHLADRLNVSKGFAHKLVAEGMAAKAMEVSREAGQYLEQDWHRTEELLDKFHPAAVDDGDEKAAKIVLDAIELRAKLRGYFAPTKHIVGGTDLPFVPREQMKAEIHNRVAKILETSSN